MSDASKVDDASVLALLRGIVRAAVKHNAGEVGTYAEVAHEGRIRRHDRVRVV